MSEAVNIQNTNIKICIQCNQPFSGRRADSKTCSRKCIAKINNLKRSTVKLKERLENITDPVKCLMCDYASTSLQSHIQHHHNMSIAEYKDKFNVDNTAIYHQSYTKFFSDKILGENNPAHDHGGKFSPYSKNFIKYDGMHDDEKEQNIASIVTKAGNTKDINETHTTRIEYYINKGMTREEAQDALSLRQTTFSLEKCIADHGEIEGLEVWKNRQEKWNKNFKKNNYSMISQKLFNQITDTVGMDRAKTFKYATSGEYNFNNEQIIKLNDRVIKPDFYDTTTNKIIDFYGDYWHGEARGNKQRDAAREQAMRDSGYIFLIIQERDYKSNPEKIVQQCVNFLLE